MKALHGAPVILIADDDADDRELVSEALREAHVWNEIHAVEDGVELLDYLHRRGRHEGLRDIALPGLMLLDLNMPRKDGRTALAEIKADPRLRRIPVVVMTTSSSVEDLERICALDAELFVIKPVTFQELVEVMRGLRQLWPDIAPLSRTYDRG